MDHSPQKPGTCFNMKDKLQTTMLRDTISNSEILEHPNIFQFVETINQELRSSHDEAVMEQAVWGMVREVDEDDLDTEVEIQSTNTEDTEKRS